MIPHWLVASALILSTAWSHWFGAGGVNGIAGNCGRDGRSGDRAIIVAQGQRELLDLRGEDGADGGNGSDGLPARDCRQPDPGALDVFGADGGIGGDAGAGGAGGNGGELTVSYADIADLGALRVDVSPGRAGAAGAPGRGARGCVCRQKEWISGGREFHCRDGIPGRDGLLAEAREAARPGIVSLVDESLPPSENSAVVQLFEIPRAVTLSEPIWEWRSGAAGLFAPGSRVPDLYRAYAGRHEFPVEVLWNARIPASEFPDTAVSLYLVGGLLSAALPDGIWWEISVGGSPELALVTVEKAVFATQTNLLSAKLAGHGARTRIEIDDSARVSDLVDTSVQARVVTGGLFGRTRFAGKVPRELLEMTDASVSFELARLPGIDPRALEGGGRVRVALTVTRFLGQSSAQTDLVARRDAD